MFSHYLYRISAGLLVLSTLGHTLGGMLGTARRGPQAGPEADAVLASMKSVRFKWGGAECTWFGFWLGNGLCVTALLVLDVAVLWVLGGLAPDETRAVLPLVLAAPASLAALAFLGFRYFNVGVGVGFGLIAALAAGGAAVSLSGGG